jgi:hypothetical protein
MPKKSRTASQRAREAARQGAKYTTAFRAYVRSEASPEPYDCDTLKFVDTEALQFAAVKALEFPDLEG